jgi:hypothetical protein
VRRETFLLSAQPLWPVGRTTGTGRSDCRVSRQDADRGGTSDLQTRAQIAEFPNLWIKPSWVFANSACLASTASDWKRVGQNIQQWIRLRRRAQAAAITAEVQRRSHRALARAF